MSDSDSEDDGDEDGSAIRSLRPCPVPEATISAKKMRYTSWLGDPSKATQDIEQQQIAIAGAKRDLASLESQEAHWLSSFELARHRLNDSLIQCREDNIVLSNAGKRLLQSCFNTTKTKTRAKHARRTSTMRDLAVALDDAQGLLHASIDVYLNTPTHSGELVDMALEDLSLIDCPPFTAPPLNGLKTDASLVKDVTWICPSCSTSNVRSGEGDRLCEGCDSTLKEGDDEDPSSTTSSSSLPGDKTLKQFFAGVDQQVRHHENAQSDLEAFFPEDEYGTVEPGTFASELKQERNVNAQSKASAVCPSMTDMEAASRSLFDDTTESRWRDTIAESGRSLPSLASRRRRRNNNSSIPLQAFVIPRTPRHVPLFLSPLSQHPDKYLGACMGDVKVVLDDTAHTSDQYLPQVIRNYETTALVKNEIKGLVRITERETQVILAASNEWQQQSAEADMCLKKATQALVVVTQESCEWAKYKNQPLSLALIDLKEHAPQAPCSPRLPAKNNKRGGGGNHKVSEVVEAFAVEEPKLVAERPKGKDTKAFAASVPEIKKKPAAPAVVTSSIAPAKPASRKSSAKK
jgi:hypothetical protein